MRRRIASLAVLCLFALFAPGCNRVERSLQVTSDPPGALVYLNGQEAGRTPMNKSFIWYGTYDVQVRKEGYKTIVTKEMVGAPWWQIPPFDLVVDLLPFPMRDQHKKSYTLTPFSEAPEETTELLARGERLRGQLEGSHEKETRAKQEAALRGETPESPK